jgi:hypothetical protein
MKIYYYVMFATLLMCLFYVAGFDFTASSWVFTNLGVDNIDNYQSSVFYLKLVAIFGLIGVAGGIVGSITRTSPTYAIKGLYIMGVLGLLVGDFIAIMNELPQVGAAAWAHWVAFIILVPLIAGYFIALLEFWEGRD